MLDINFFPSVLVLDGAAFTPRDYRTHVTSHAGSIAGRYLHGSSTTLETDFGAVDVALLPRRGARPGGDDDETASPRAPSAGASPSRCWTRLPPPGRTGGRRRRCAARRAITRRAWATVSVRYPAAWQGAVEGESRMGARADGGRGAPR